MTSRKHRFAPSKESQAAVTAGDTLGRLVFKELVSRDMTSFDGVNLLMIRFYDLVERPFLEEVMKLTKGNQSKAAVMLGLHRSTLRRLCQRYKLTGRRERHDSY